LRPHDPIPVDGFLVDVPDTHAPYGFTVVDQQVTGALPLRIPLFADVALMLVVPTGLGRQWRGFAPADVISTGGDEREPLDPANPPAAAPERSPTRLYLVGGSATLGIVPLTAGLRTVVEADAGTLVELLILAWEVHAGTVTSGGDVGSRVTVAWRDASHAPSQFSPDPIHPRVVARRHWGGRIPARSAA
jgi:hypothetical protein